MSKQIIIGIGVVLAVLALTWWGLVFNAVAGMNGEPLLAYASCFLLPTETCNFYRGMGWMQGQPIYEPGLAWVALAMLFTGVFSRSPN